MLIYGIRCCVQRGFGLCIINNLLGLFALNLCSWNNANSLRERPSARVCRLDARQLSALAVVCICVWKFVKRKYKVCAVHTHTREQMPAAYRCASWSERCWSTLKHIIIQELNIIVALVINYSQTRFHYIRMQFDVQDDSFVALHLTSRHAELNIWRSHFTCCCCWCSCVQWGFGVDYLCSHSTLIVDAKSLLNHSLHGSFVGFGFGTSSLSQPHMNNFNA